MRALRPLAAIAALIFLVGAIALPADAKKRKKKGFTPLTLAGIWTGTWNNSTYGSTGPATITVKSLAKNTQISVSATLGGNVFGCPNPAPETAAPLTKGTGANHWNAAGFNAQQSSKLLGTTKLLYVFKTGKLTGSGSAPTCNANINWTVNGQFTKNSFNATLAIDLGGGVTAQSTVTLARS